MSQTVQITFAILDSAELVSNLVGEKCDLNKVISLCRAVESGTMSASCLVNVDDTTFTVLTEG